MIGKSKYLKYISLSANYIERRVPDAICQLLHLGEFRCLFQILTHFMFFIFIIFHVSSHK